MVNRANGHGDACRFSVLVAAERPYGRAATGPIVMTPAARPQRADQVAREAVRGAEVVDLYDAVAALSADGRHWQVQIGARVFRPCRSRMRKALIRRLFSSRYGLVTDAESGPDFDRRINLLLADNRRGRRPVVTLLGERFALPRTSGSGHTAGTLEIPRDMLAPGSIIPMTAAAATGPATVTAVAPDGLSIICDIDDTVKSTGVRSRRALWESTFFKPFSVVPGMADMLARLGGGGLPVHYVSSTPWHLHTPVREWMVACGLPLASMHLKHIRLVDKSVFDILAVPQRTKPPPIFRLLDRFPNRRFILIGDDVEKDPAIYAAIWAARPDQISRILIRRTPGGPGAGQIAGALSAVPAGIWTVFEDPAEVLA